MAVTKPPSCDAKDWVLTGSVGSSEGLQRALDENAVLKDRISALEENLLIQREQTDSKIREQARIIQRQELQMQQMQERNLRDSEIASDQIDRLESKLLKATAIKDKYHNIILSLYGDLKNDKGIFKLTDIKNKFHAIIIDLYEEIFGQIDKIRILEGESEEKTRLIRTLKESLKRREGLLRQFREQQQQLELKEQALQSTNKEKRQLQKACASLECQISLLMEMVEKGNSQIGEYTNLFLTSEDEKKRNIKGLLKIIAQYEEQLETHQKEIQALVDQSNILRAEVQYLKYQNTILTTQKDSFKNTIVRFIRNASVPNTFEFFRFGQNINMREFAFLFPLILGKTLYDTSLFSNVQDYSRNQLAISIAGAQRKIEASRREIQDLGEKLPFATDEEANSIEASLQDKRKELDGLKIVLQSYREIQD